MRGFLTNQDTHVKLEQQSRTVILFSDDGVATIQACDHVAVVMALSAIEDMISNYQQVDLTTDTGKFISRVSDMKYCLCMNGFKKKF